MQSATQGDSGFRVPGPAKAAPEVHAHEKRRNSVDAAGAATPDWRARSRASVGAPQHAIRRVSTPVVHLHPSRAPTAASVTAAAAIESGGRGRPYPPSPRPHAAPPLVASRRAMVGAEAPLAPTMADAAAAAAEDEGEQMCVRALEEAQARIVAEREEIARIEALLDEINKTRAAEGPDAEVFEEEDVREVESEIAARQEVLKAMEADLEARITKYETEVSVVANAIRKRASVLKAAEQRTRVLSENPRLMAFFAHKQNDLIEIRKKLYSALAEDRAPVAPLPSSS